MHDHALRPATRIVHQHLTGLGDRAIGLTLERIRLELALAERTVRRAAVELEEAGLVAFVRDSSSAKCVGALTKTGPAPCAIPRESGPRMRDSERVRPKSAQVGPSRPSEIAHVRPKSAQAPSLLVNYNVDTAAAVACTTRARPPAFEQQQQRQQLLALEVSDGRALVDVRAMLDRLDAVVRDVWRRVGRTHGFLAVDERALAGLELAMRRYPLPEIEACVVWSAERVAAGALSLGYFATTFRGNAFGARYAAWQAELEQLERRRRQDAAIAADVRAHRPEQAELPLSGAALEHASRAALAELERMAAGGAP